MKKNHCHHHQPAQKEDKSETATRENNCTYCFKNNITFSAIKIATNTTTRTTTAMTQRKKKQQQHVKQKPVEFESNGKGGRPKTYTKGGTRRLEYDAMERNWIFNVIGMRPNHFSFLLFLFLFYGVIVFFFFFFFLVLTLCGHYFPFANHLARFSAVSLPHSLTHLLSVFSILCICIFSNYEFNGWWLFCRSPMSLRNYEMYKQNEQPTT